MTTHGITAGDISVKTKVVSQIPVPTFCDCCDLERDACILVQNWVHGSLYVCPECRQQAGIETEADRAAAYDERQRRKKKEEEGSG